MRPARRRDVPWSPRRSSRLTRYVALFRGINVGGSHRVAMAELRALFEGAGLEGVSTYIQSGNVVFNSERDEADLASALAAVLRDRFGFEIPVVIREGEAFRAAARRHPLAAAQQDERLLHVVFLGATPAAEAIRAFDAAAFLPDECTLDGRELYVAYRHGSARSRLSVDAAERALGSTATGRNWRTVGKLAELLADAP